MRLRVCFRPPARARSHPATAPPASHHTQTPPGAVAGGVLFALSCWLLWWNEGNCVRAAKALKKVVGETASLSSLDDAKAVPPGSVVCVCGRATTVAQGAALADDKMGVRATPGALRLKRDVQFFVWEETSKSSTQKELGGSKTTTTEYTYNRRWCKAPIDSKKFKKNPDAYKNPDVNSFPLKSGEVSLQQCLRRLCCGELLRQSWWDCDSNHFCRCGTRLRRCLRTAAAQRSRSRQTSYPVSTHGRPWARRGT